uniref:AAA_lid_3 domain-containing protein n=1 Tax=Heterorhabditis bacteriophora TaxID=37862 RepID=A0A1I7WN44_HETBA
MSSVALQEIGIFNITRPSGPQPLLDPFSNKDVSDTDQDDYNKLVVTLDMIFHTRTFLSNNCYRRQKRLVFTTITAKMNLADDVDLEDFVARPDSVSGADINAICQEVIILETNITKLFYAENVINTKKYLLFC